MSALPPILAFSAASLAGLWVAWRMYGSTTARGAGVEELSRAPVPRVLAG